MEIRFQTLVGQGPEGQPAVLRLEHGADADLQGLVGGNNGGQINLQGEPQGLGFPVDGEGQRLEGRLLLDALAIVG